MEEYFSATLNKLKSNNYEELHLVLGNESCDLDSAVSAIVYAVFLNWQHNQIKCKVCTRNKRDTDCKDDIFIAMLDVERADFPLKTEVAFCLKDHGITEKAILFKDDINIKQLINSKKTNIILVDHHTLSQKYDFLAPYVTEIIDHRPLDKSHWKFNEDVRSTIEVVGSCCTLVAQRVKDLSALTSKDVDFFNSHPICSDLLYSVILLDTVNFSKEVNKATPHDKDVVLFLEGLLKFDNSEEERARRVERLVAARSDASGLSAAQLLRKDCKSLEHIIVPSFPILVEEFLQKPKALEAVTEALRGQDCFLALLLGMNLKGGLKRDTAIICSTDDKRGEDLAKFLQEWSSPPLQLEPDPAIYRLYFKQMNLSASRKQYIPALNEFLKSIQ